MGSISLELNTMPVMQVTPPPADVPATQPVALEPAAPSETAPDTAPKSMTVEQDHLVAQYDYNDELHQVIITLQRSDTGEVIQQLPAEQVINLLQGMMERLGQMVDRRG